MRLVTLDIAVMLIRNLVTRPDGTVALEDGHFAEIEGVREESTLLLRNFYKVRSKCDLNNGRRKGGGIFFCGQFLTRVCRVGRVRGRRPVLNGILLVRPSAQSCGNSICIHSPLGRTGGELIWGCPDCQGGKRGSCGGGGEGGRIGKRDPLTLARSRPTTLVRADIVKGRCQGGRKQERDPFTDLRRG